MSDNEERVVTQNLSLYPQDLAVLRQVGKDYGLGSVSAAARLIIREWMQFKRVQREAQQRSQSENGGDGTRQVREWCRRLGLDYQGVTIHEGTAIVVATDRDGEIQFHSFAALYRLAHAQHAD